MSEHIKIAAEPRQITGKQVKQLRRDGLIPAVIYGRLSRLTFSWTISSCAVCCARPVAPI
jgi:ribosomal protein L25 (general stress protein Ctc)